MYRKYSTIFATKLNYIMDLEDEMPLYTGRVQAIEKRLSEKDTTIKNWLFNAKLPRRIKWINIADSLGVSEEYLFNDAIDIFDIKQPEIYKGNECYYVPFIKNNQIFSLSDRVLRVESRIPIMLPTMSDMVDKYGTSIFATNFQDQGLILDNGDSITAIFTEHLKYEEYQIVITSDKHGQPVLRKIIEDDNGLLKLQYYENSKEHLEYINPKNKYYLVLFSFNRFITT